MNLINIPVVYFVYNRPDLTVKSFEVIKKLKPRILFIISDGPKFPKDLHDINKVRKIVSNINWKCKVYNKFSKINLGNKISTEKGLDYVFSLYDKLIFMEDDSLPSEDFFRFCSMNLKKYENFEQVYAIGGNNPFNNITLKSNSSYFFSFYPRLSCFAFWKRSWDLYEKKIDKFWIKNIFLKNYYKKFDSFLSYLHFSNTFNYFFLKTKKMDAWDFIFFCNIVCKLKEPLCIVPVKNLYLNIGINHAKGTTPVQLKIADIFKNNRLFRINKIIHPKKIIKDYNFDKKIFNAVFFNKNKNFLVYYRDILLLILRFFYSTLRVFCYTVYLKYLSIYAEKFK
jgi:hypothetical protein